MSGAERSCPALWPAIPNSDHKISDHWMLLLYRLNVVFCAQCEVNFGQLLVKVSEGCSNFQISLVLDNSHARKRVLNREHALFHPSDPLRMGVQEMLHIGVPFLHVFGVPIELFWPCCAFLAMLSASIDLFRMSASSMRLALSSGGLPTLIDS